MKKVNEIIKERREELGLSLEQVATVVGVNNSTVSRWETGNIDNMKRDKIVKLADCLKISPAVIMGWDENKKEHVTISISDGRIAKVVANIKEFEPEKRDRILETIEAIIDVEKKRKS